MKSSGWILTACFSSAVSGLFGCGQKGPLLLPEHNGTVITRPADATNGTPGTQQEQSSRGLPQAAPTQATTPGQAAWPDPKKSADRHDTRNPTPK